MTTVCQVAGMFIGGIVLMLCTTQARASYCGEPAAAATQWRTTTSDATTKVDADSNRTSELHSDITKVVVSPSTESLAARHAHAASIEPSELLGLRHGEGVRVICKRIDGVDTAEESSFQLEDVWPVETGNGRVLISAWENDANRKVVRSARMELELFQPVESAIARPVRRANAAHCTNTVTGRCSSALEIRSSVRSLGNRYRIDETTYVNGARTEWVVWLLNR